MVREYLRRAIFESGLVPIVHVSSDPVIGTYVVARKSDELNAVALATMANPADWWCEPGHLVSNRSGHRSVLELDLPPGVSLSLVIHNFSGRSLTVEMGWEEARRTLHLESGRNVVGDLQPPGQPPWPLVFECESWCPDEVIHNGDMRRLGFHVESVRFIR